MVAFNDTIGGRGEILMGERKFHIITAATRSHDEIAQRLRSSAALHKLDVEVCSIDRIHRSVSPKGCAQNLNFKAQFILQSIVERNCPVLWLDADVVVKCDLDLFNGMLSEGFELAIYNWLADDANAALKPIEYLDFMGNKRASDRYFMHSHEIRYKSSNQLLCSGAVQLWSNSPRSVALLKEWASLVVKHPTCQDDHLLDAAFNYSKKPPKLFSLPKQYCRYAFWPHVEPIIDHPDFPYSGRDWSDTNRELGKERFRLHEAVLRPPSRFVPDGMVWDRVSGLLRAKSELNVS